VGLLGAIFSWAVKRKLRPDNPCRGINKPKETKKTRRLSDDEYSQLGAALNGGVVSDIFLLLAVTGFRSSEAKTFVGKNWTWSEASQLWATQKQASVFARLAAQQSTS
jgi:hypothetical protein